jgi:hypothetical protein
MLLNTFRGGGSKTVRRAETGARDETRLLPRLITEQIRCAEFRAIFAKLFAIE